MVRSLRLLSLPCLALQLVSRRSQLVVPEHIHRTLGSAKPSDLGLEGGERGVRLRTWPVLVMVAELLKVGSCCTGQPKDRRQEKLDCSLSSGKSFRARRCRCQREIMIFVLISGLLSIDRPTLNPVASRLELLLRTGLMTRLAKALERHRASNGS